MKKYIIIVSILVVMYFVGDALYYRYGLYIDFNPSEKVTTFMKTDGKDILMKKNGKYEPFEIKGVNLGAGIPGKWATDFAIDKKTYKRWFKYIQQMGANTIRVYTVQNDTFYDAFYEYNEDNKNPLWMLHGVWVNDYIQNSHRDGYDKEFYDTFLSDCKTVSDVIHGNKKISLGRMDSSGSGAYFNDVSNWVIGYILGVEWEDVTVAYTNEKYKKNNKYTSYHGKYMYSSVQASPFEVMLTKVGDKLIEYESNRYKEQRLVAFSNWPTTDPFVYPKDVSDFFKKCTEVDTTHIRTTDKVISGMFTSYHIYPYFPDYLNYIKDWSRYGIDKNDFKLKAGKINTYRAYLTMVNKYHSTPVVISEFGVSTGRGMAQRDHNTNRNQGHMSEKGQGKALVSCYKDIKAAGCNGGCVFTWQDEWFKRTWNTMYAVNLRRNPYWSDYQTNEQYFGLLSFDPGKKKSKCYVDGDISDWKNDKEVFKTRDYSLSMKYDERFLYFLIRKKDLNIDKDKLYIPIDTTQKSGSSYYKNILFDKGVDFIVEINGKNNSRVKVQERYDSLRANYSDNVYKINAYLKKNIPDKNTSKFVNIDMILQTATTLLTKRPDAPAEVYETGKLKYGNANPDSKDFNSLADFKARGDYVELKLPWQLLNFADPSQMSIHDDYYENYGISYQNIDHMNVGVCGKKSGVRNKLKPFELKAWDNDVTYHERLKSSYYKLQKEWRK